MTSTQAQALVGQSITLNGVSGVVQEWAQEHPMAIKHGSEGFISTDTDPNGWLRVALVSGGRGQWWRVGMVSQCMGQRINMAA